MVSKIFPLLTLVVAFFVGALPIYSAQRTLDSVAAYQCTSDYAKVANPSEISSKSPKLRVCIKGVVGAVQCRKVVEATVLQASKEIQDKLVVGGKEQAAFKDIIEITAQGGKCMVTVLLTNKYFMASSEADSLQVVLSGSVATASTSKTSTATSTANITAVSSGSRLTKLPFELAVKLTPSGYTVDATSVIKAYQCTSDYAQVPDPHPISAENRMLRVCVEGSHSAVECQKFLEATVTQASKNIADRVVVRGQQQAAFRDITEITTQGGVCMVAKVLTGKYFIKSTSGESLQVVISGSVSVAPPASAKAAPSGHYLRKEPSEGAEAPFALVVNLGNDEDEEGMYPEEMYAVEDAGARARSITAGLIAVIAVLI